MICFGALCCCRLLLNCVGLHLLLCCAAEPIIAEAEAALNSLDKGSLGELKSFGSPAAEIVQVGALLVCDPQRLP